MSSTDNLIHVVGGLDEADHARKLSAHALPVSDALTLGHAGPNAVACTVPVAPHGLCRTPTQFRPALLHRAHRGRFMPGVQRIPTSVSPPAPHLVKPNCGSPLGAAATGKARHNSIARIATNCALCHNMQFSPSASHYGRLVPSQV